MRNTCIGMYYDVLWYGAHDTRNTYVLRRITTYHGRGHMIHVLRMYYDVLWFSDAIHAIHVIVCVSGMYLECILHCIMREALVGGGGVVIHAARLVLQCITNVLRREKKKDGGQRVIHCIAHVS